MNRKILSLFLLTAILALSLVSALNMDASVSNTLSKSVNSAMLTVKNNEASALSVSVSVPPTITDGSKTITISSAGTVFSLASGATANVNVSRGAVPSGFRLGDYSSNIVINAVDATNPSNTDSRTVALTFQSAYCTAGVNDSISITRVRDEQKDNADEWKWRPLDNIEITVRVNNELGDDIDAVVEYGLYDIDNHDFIDLDDDTAEISVDDGKSEDAVITLQVPADIDSNNDYRFYVKAYEDGREKQACTDVFGDSFYEDVTIKQESRDVIVSDINIPETVSCGDAITATAKVYNTGRNDEDRVKVRIYNRELGIDSSQEIKNMDSGDSSSITFNFNIPSNATEKKYIIIYSTQFDYDSDTETYDKSSSDPFDREMTVSGNCKQIVSVQDNAQITASLESEAVAGSEIVIRATVKNIGSSTAVYQVLVSGYDAFATLEKEVTPSLVTLEAGKSQDVLIYLKANSQASGDYTFIVKALSGTKIKEQTVSLSVTPKSSPFGSLNIFGNLQENWFIWVVVLINVVLIVLIIVVAVRIARK